MFSCSIPFDRISDINFSLNTNESVSLCFTLVIDKMFLNTMICFVHFGGPYAVLHQKLFSWCPIMCFMMWFSVFKEMYIDFPVYIYGMVLNTKKHDVFIVSSCCAQANMALFEACCKEKIQQFEDTGSDEEDIWDEKDVTFAPEAQRRPRFHTFSLEHGFHHAIQLF